ncbi:flagellar basal-body MS-ring/collar protein FliF [Paenibacillus eucommiae]|uniref:Flagellar M-ring protein n=1 Tax=Paenibacillus eucommiae TaxID=1355755 RepID=A0ABS4IUS6_9BACL|nr:flagellar basal-body MS-ring/collar protein FliF [Paenibacillus eucommiae]MBP1991341.1 flagellar M-ring protein FliF [Paenibacillus eucommiae]
MNETILQYWNKTKQYWNRYSKSQKITFISILVLLLLSIGIIGYNMSKTEYSLAFTDLPPNDAAAITGYLDTAKIPYKLSSDGKSIEVPTNKVASVRIEVESQGLNQNGSLGFAVFRESGSFGITDNEFKVKYADAVQGELQQAINSIQAINSSKVLISMPEEFAFKKPEEEKATASVVLLVKTGYTLAQTQVDAIYNLVSHSVKNLPIENISITNQYGEELVSSKLNGGQNATNVVTGQFEINNQFRNDLQRNITNLLGALYGKDKVIVSVFSTMNFDQKRSTENLVTAPNEVDMKGLEISLQEATSSYESDGGADASGGVPGTGSTDVPGYPGSTGSGKTSSEETTRTVNSEVNRIKNDIVSTPYVVKDLSINVGIEPPVKEDPLSLTDESKTAIQNALTNIVRAALADNKVTYTDEELTKKVTVIAHSFVRPTDGTASKTQTYLIYGGLVLAALALGGIGAYVLMRRKKAQQMEEEMEIPAKIELPTIDIESVSNDNQMRKQLETLAKKRPEDFVNLLRTWLVDE